MTEITIEIPDSLNKVLPVLKKPFLLRVMRNLAKTKIEENKEQLKEAQKNIHNFEKRYTTTFEAFKANFPPAADVQFHEDFVEWSFWVDVRDRLNEEINIFKKLNGIQG
jgi:small-conductance mechanosensitive channel